MEKIYSSVSNDNISNYNFDVNSKILKMSSRHRGKNKQKYREWLCSWLYSAQSPPAIISSLPRKHKPN
jgi:hypothetical protein